MSDPTLFVVAGCNGSGKSTFSNLLAPSNLSSFDYDLHFLKYYRSLFDSDIREEMAHNMAFTELKKQIDDAVTNSTNFCYETNFNSTPLHWPQYFKQNGYKLHLIYFCMDSIEEAKRRVNIRVQNGGHFVSESEIEKRYFEGFANLNAHFAYFDLIDMFDTSAYSKQPRYIFSIEGGEITTKRDFPQYLAHLIPAVVGESY